MPERLSIHIEISAAPLNTALIRIVTRFYKKLNQHAHGTTEQTMKIFRFFYYIWFIDSEILCFILILKEKMARL